MVKSSYAGAGRRARGGVQSPVPGCAESSCAEEGFIRSKSRMTDSQEALAFGRWQSSVSHCKCPVLLPVSWENLGQSQALGTHFPYL